MAGEINQYGIQAFGQYLTERAVQLEAELYSTCANDKMELATVKRKYGQLEAAKVILKAFTDLYEGDVSKFKKEYLDERDESEDGDGSQSQEDSGGT
jgi:hypothetical protein